MKINDWRLTMRIKKLIFEDKPYTDPVLIESLLQKNSLSWLNKAEIENAIVEIKDSKLYWHRGIWYYGDWEYGLWLDGEFRYGNWYNGVWYNGTFKNGTWHNGIFMNGVFENGEFLDGEFRDGVKKGGDFKIDLKESNAVVKFSHYKK
jgi:hypothetical protein